MKRLVFFCILLAASVFAADVSGDFGSRENPVPIRSYESLVDLRDSVNACAGTFKVLDESGKAVGSVDVSNGAPGMYFVLTDDIDMAADGRADKSWIPIGSENCPFRANFDGAHHVIKGLKQFPPEFVWPTFNETGLFGYIEDTKSDSIVFKNLRLDSVDIYIKQGIESIYASAVMGGISGNNVVVRDCAVSGKMYVSQNNGRNSTFSIRASGITNSAGTTNGNGLILFENDTNRVNIMVEGVAQNHVAGVLGWVSVSGVVMRSCVNEGTITLFNAGGGAVGGLSADISPAYKRAVLENNVNNGKIIVDSTNTALMVGGLVGNFAPNGAELRGNRNNADIVVNSNGYLWMQVGGFAGRSVWDSHVVIEDNENYGNISFMNEFSEENGARLVYAGGFFGSADMYTQGGELSYSMANNVNHGDINLKGDTRIASVGGIVGRVPRYAMDVVIENFRNYGDMNVETSGAADSIFVGGLAGLIASKSKTRMELSGFNFGKVNLVTDGNAQGVAYAGGLVGRFDGSILTIDSSLSIGDVHAEGSELSLLSVGGIAGFTGGDGVGIENTGVYGNIDVRYDKRYGTGYVGAAFGRTRDLMMENVLLAGSVRVASIDRRTLAAPYVGFMEGLVLAMKNVLNVASFKVTGARHGMTALFSDENECGYAFSGLYADDKLLLKEYANDPNDFRKVPYGESGFAALGTAELTSGTLPEDYTEDAWVATAGYYPQLKFANECVPEVSATAATPVSLADTDCVEEVLSKTLPLLLGNAEGSTLNWHSEIGDVAGGNVSYEKAKRNATDMLTAFTEDYSKIWYLDIHVDDRQDFDMSNVAWIYGQPFVYDGEEHAVTLRGLPEGLTAKYTDNVKTKPGDYLAKAAFEFDSTLYYAPEFVDSIKWKIVKDTIDVSNFKWVYEPFVTYDGEEHTATLSGIPEGLTVKYTDNVKTKPGDYLAKAKVEYDTTLHYLPAFKDSLVRKIVKSILDASNIKWTYDSAFVFDGETHTVKLENVPDEITVKYSGNSAKEAGKYTARYTLDYDTALYELLDYSPVNLQWEIVKPADTSKTALPLVPTVSFGIVRNGADIVLHGAAAVKNVKVFDALGNEIRIRSIAGANGIVLKNVPQGRGLFAQVRLANGGHAQFRLD